MTDSELVTIRKPVPTDVEFLLKTWMRDYRRSMPVKLPDRIYYQKLQEIIYLLVKKSDCRIVCTTNDHNYIIGFVVASVHPDAETAVVHYAYMRPPFRRAGFATAALEQMGYRPGYEIIATHWTAKLNTFVRDDLIYNPYVLYWIQT